MDAKQLSKFMRARRPEINALIIYLAIALVMFWIVTVNITGYVVNGGGDVYQSLFNLWWVPYSIFMLHQSPYFTNLLYYPVGANLVTQTLTPLAGIIASPLTILNRALAYNALFFASFALSGLFMYMLAYYVTKNRYASFIAGLVFAFSPFHIAQSYNHLDWTVIEFVPLYILFYLRTVRERKFKYALVAALSFMLLTFMGDIEQGIIMATFTIVSYPILLVMERSKIKAKESLKSLATMAGLALLFYSPFIVMMAPYLNSAALSTANNAQLTGRMIWSDSIASYLTPSYYNGIFHSYFNQTIAYMTYDGIRYQTYDIWERTSYMGYSVIFLALLAVLIGLRERKLRTTGFWMLIAAIFVLLSLGPYLQISSAATGVPTLYTLYMHIPLFNIVAEPGRFDLIVTACAAVLAAVGFADLAKRIDSKYLLACTAITAVIILVEYNGMPLSLSYANSLITATNVPSIYANLSGSSSNFTLLTIPSIPSYGSQNYTYYTGLATYYTSFLRKPIISGYVSRENQSQGRLIQLIPLLNESTSLSQGQGFVYPSPLATNFTNVTLLWLVNFRIGYISVLRGAFSPSEQQTIYDYMYGVFGPPTYADNSTYVFSTQSAIAAHAGKSIAMETSGPWVPGYSFCYDPQQCNPYLADSWWGGNARGLLVYAPADQSAAMSIVALSAYNGSVLQISEDGVQPVYLQLNQTPRNYTIMLNLSRGWTGIDLYQSPEYNESGLNYGIQSISIRAGMPDNISSANR